jgi:hypothetical protein
VPATADGGAQILRYEILNLTEKHWVVAGTVIPGRENHTIEPQMEVAGASRSLLYLLHGLRPGGNYTVAVHACNKHGCGLKTNAIHAATESKSSPDAPAAANLVSATTTALTIRWLKPDDNGAAITNYTIQRDDWWNAIDPAHISAGPTITIPAPAPSSADGRGDGDSTFIQVTLDSKLLPASRYAIRVKAGNSAGYSAWSPTVQMMTNEGGHCGNPADIAVSQRTKTTMKSQIQVSTSLVLPTALDDPLCALWCRNA